MTTIATRSPTPHPLGRNDTRWNPYRGCPRGHIAQHDGIGPNLRVIADRDPAKQLRARTNVHVPPYRRYAGPPAAGADRHLLKDCTVWADEGLRMYDNSIG